MWTGDTDENLRRGLLRFIGGFAGRKQSSHASCLEVSRGLVRAAYADEPPLVRGVRGRAAVQRRPSCRLLQASPECRRAGFPAVGAWVRLGTQARRCTAVQYRLRMHGRTDGLRRARLRHILYSRPPDASQSGIYKKRPCRRARVADRSRAAKPMASKTIEAETLNGVDDNSDHLGR